MRSRWCRSAGLGVAVLFILLPSQARAQSASVRGSVVDEQGAPLPGVQVQLEYLGESRRKIVKKLTTDKKGGFVQVGLAGGLWRFTFAKEGFKTDGLESHLSLGGVSEIPAVTLSPAPPPVPAAAAATAPDAAALAGVAELEATYAKGVEALAAGQDAEAEALFKQVLEKAPGVGAAHYNLGLIAMKRKDLSAAESAFRKDVELRPQEPKAYVALATLLGSVQRGDEALALLQEAAGSFATNGNFQFALGVAALNAGRDAEAQPALMKAAELDPANAEARYYLGTLAMGQNEAATAMTHFKRYLELAPQGPNAAVAAKLLEALKARK
jgi:Flp pilus assembly protein TadD